MLSGAMNKNLSMTTHTKKYRENKCCIHWWDYALQVLLREVVWMCDGAVKMNEAHCEGLLLVSPLRSCTQRYPLFGHSDSLTHPESQLTTAAQCGIAAHTSFLLRQLQKYVACM